MKKSLISLFVSAIVLLISCKKDDNSTSPITTATVNNTVTSGTWRVTYYWGTDEDKTAGFNGYAFTFGSGNILTATKATSTVSGTWSTGTDDSTVKLILDFSTASLFEEINDDWHVTERTATKITLQDVSGGNGETDYLTFEKN